MKAKSPNSSQIFSIFKLLKKYVVLQPWFWLYMVFGVGLRTYNLPNFLFFIYDQGRDALVLRNMLAGDFVLVGPTTGLAGFFLGPLWYYLGLPGFILSGGNPVGVSLWYILISCLSLPLYWWLCHKLFKDQIFAKVVAVFLAFIPGSIQASVTIWNPLLAAPLTMGSLWSLFQARQTTGWLSRIWLTVSVTLVALILQSEFAYGVFIVPFVWLAIKWLKPKANLLDYGLAALGMGATLLPQLLFELRNNFIMTRSLLGALTSSTVSLPWPEFWELRYAQLWGATRELFLGPGPKPVLESWLLGSLLIIATVGLGVQLWWPSLNTKFDSKTRFWWRLIWLAWVWPYPFFMIWRGNNGNFFAYYLTSHFVFGLPVLGMIWELVPKWWQFKQKQVMQIGLRVALVGMGLLMLKNAWGHWSVTVGNPPQNSGLKFMIQAVDQVYAWRSEDQASRSAILVFTPNIYTEHHDYILDWRAKQQGLPVSTTVLQGNEDVWYLLIENWGEYKSPIFPDWYKKATLNGELKRREQVGSLTLETWQSQ
jgi:hypothetical protein